VIECSQLDPLLYYEAEEVPHIVMDRQPSRLGSNLKEWSAAMLCVP